MKKNFIDKMANSLRMAATELEELQLQFALGKADVADKYEEIKAEFAKFIHVTLDKLNEDGLSYLRAKFEELQLQLALGKAENKEAFEKQRKKIEKVINEIENSLGAKELDAELRIKLSIQLEKFKIRLEMLRLQFELGKMDIKDAFEKNRAGLIKKIEELKVKFSEKEGTIEHDLEALGHELKKTYDDFKRVFTS